MKHARQWRILSLVEITDEHFLAHPTALCEKHNLISILQMMAEEEKATVCAFSDYEGLDPKCLKCKELLIDHINNEYCTNCSKYLHQCPNSFDVSDSE